MEDYLRDLKSCRTLVADFWTNTRICTIQCYVQSTCLCIFSFTKEQLILNIMIHGHESTNCANCDSLFPQIPYCPTILHKLLISTALLSDLCKIGFHIHTSPMGKLLLHASFFHCTLLSFSCSLSFQGNSNFSPLHDLTFHVQLTCYHPY